MRDKNCLKETVFGGEQYLTKIQILKGKLGSRKIFPRMKVHIIKYLKIAMIYSVIRFDENNRVDKIVILLL